MKKVLDAMLAALARGERVTLCSVLASSGSAPRGAEPEEASTLQSVTRSPRASAASIASSTFFIRRHYPFKSITLWQDYSK